MVIDMNRRQFLLGTSALVTASVINQNPIQTVETIKVSTDGVNWSFKDQCIDWGAVAKLYNGPNRNYHRRMIEAHKKWTVPA